MELPWPSGACSGPRYGPCCGCGRCGCDSLAPVPKGILPRAGAAYCESAQGLSPEPRGVPYTCSGLPGGEWLGSVSHL